MTYNFECFVIDDEVAVAVGRDLCVLKRWEVARRLVGFSMLDCALGICR
jgi:hypothetical protein